jgi:hypothetical protein
VSPAAKAQDAVVDLTALPDPRPVVPQTIVITRRLDDVLEGASRRFQHAHATVASEVQEWEEQVLQGRLDRRHLGHRAAATVEHLDHLLAALADAELQHDANITILVRYEQAVAQMARSTLPAEVRSAAGFKARTAELVVADGDLRAAVARARPAIPAFTVAAARIVQAAVIVSRRRLVAEVTRQIHGARLTLNTALSHKQAHSEEERDLLALLDRMAARSGTTLPLPEVVWPATGKGSDPFAVPQLKE